jgi:hypothetical protein
MIYNSSLIGPDTSDASTQGDADVPACMSFEPPDRPPAGDGGAMGDDSGNVTLLPPIVAAFKTIDIGAAGAPDAAIPAFGYDLDKTCTCPGPPSCLQPKGAFSGEDCDNHGGLDNKSIQLFRLLPAPASTGTTQVDQGLMAGQYGLLIRISNYNGMPNDPNITVDFYVSNGLERDDAGAIPTPKFDGTDRWTIDPGSIQNGTQAMFSDDSAYVTTTGTAGSPVFVAHFSQLPISFGDRTILGGATMQLSDAIVTGTIQPVPYDGGSGVGLGIMQGTIAGRWPTKQILSTVATIPEEGGFLCGSDPNPYNAESYVVLKVIVCEAADITHEQSQDKMGAPCDAISVGMQFSAVPALLGDPLMVPPAPAGCVDGGAMWSDQCP